MNCTCVRHLRKNTTASSGRTKAQSIEETLQTDGDLLHDYRHFTEGRVVTSMKRYRERVESSQQV